MPDIPLEAAIRLSFSPATSFPSTLRNIGDTGL
jgi:hypothetical protein